MRHIIFGARATSYAVAFLTPQLDRTAMLREYIQPAGLNPDWCVGIDLYTHPTKKKTPVKAMKQYVNEELVDALTQIDVKYIVVGDAEYFKVLSGKPKAEPYLGYVLPCAYGPWHVIYVPNYKAVFYNPDKLRDRIARSMNGLRQHAQGSYQEPGHSIIRDARYISDPSDIEAALEELLQMDTDLTCDAETFSLKPNTAGLGTITFCWDKHSGYAFPIDLRFDAGEALQIRSLLISFFERFKRKLIFHNIAFDGTILIYQLWMDDILDTEGLLRGLDIILRDWDCTKLITYLATNSCAQRDLSLKSNAQEFAGNWAVEEIKDITRIPLPQLLEYNLVDGISTWFVKEKYEPVMDADDQREIYETIFKPAMWDIIQMQLTGLPVDMNQVKEARIELESDETAALNKMRSTQVVADFNHRLNLAWVHDYNTTRKVKRVTLADANEIFNPNSGPQLIELLFEMLELPVLERTDSDQPATGTKVIKALRHHTQDPDVLQFLDGLIDYKAVNKILTSFIPAMEGAVEGHDGWHYLLGNFNLGGTLSGRLSSSDPNLQNLPSSGTRYAKIIKKCFKAPPGWLYCGLDFDSLEDRISALTTRDPNKLKVYTDGYDGHCLRAHSYFGDRMPDIHPDSVESINSIKKKYPDERQESKAPTFALTYQGTKFTLMMNCGFDALMAEQIYERYHEMYKVSTEWVNARLDEASQKGYVTVAFGLRVRTPLLKQTVRNTSKTPYEATAEGRSAGNALGQSWCMLTTRSGSEFMQKVRKSKYRLDIRPCAQIHDAHYFLIRDDIAPLLYTNEHLVKAVQWQEDPLIQHPQVKLGGKLAIFHPDWSQEIEIPNGVDEQGVHRAIKKEMEKRRQKELELA